MSRKAARLASAAVLLAGITPLVTSADAATAAVGYPKAGCFDLKDTAGDANYLNAKVPSDPDLDIIGVAFQTTATDLKWFVKVSKLANGPMAADGHRFALYFDFADHQFAASGSHFANGTGAIRDGLASSGQAGHVVQLGVDVPTVTPDIPPSAAYLNKGFVTSGITYTFDPTGSWVIGDLPLADIKKYAGKKFTGRILGVGVSASEDRYYVSQPADSTESGNSTTAFTGTFVVGSNKCFPAPKPPAHKPVKKH